MDTFEIPESVKKEAAEADRLIKEQSGQQPPEGKTDVPPTTVQPAPAPDAAKPPQPPATPPPPKEEAGDWQQKYLVLEGKYRKEVPDLHISLAQMRNQLDSVSTELKGLKEKPAAPAKAGESGPGDAEPPDLDKSEKAKAFKDEYVDVYEGSVEVARIIVRTELDKALKGFKDEIQKMISGAPNLAPPSQGQPPGSDRMARSDKEVFTDFLTERVSDWRQINVDPAFVDHLEKTADPSNPTRTKLTRLQEAYARLDVDGVARYFEEWKKGPNGQGDKGKESPPLFPPHSKGGSPPAPAGAEPMSNRKIEQFYDEQARGLWKGREAEASAFERKIMAATSAGLITP